MSALALQPTTYNFVADFLKARSGLALTTDKVYLLETRLHTVATEHQFLSVRAMLEALHAGKLPQQAQDAIVEAMTTNESLFMRDTKPFDALVNQMIPEQLALGHDDIKIWCAACSTGQEPFSIAMRIAEAASLKASVSIDATDIASKVIERARTGTFTHFEVQRGLPISYLLKYFVQVDANRWQLKPAITGQVRFCTQNLLAPFPNTPYHIVFCRYVLIYFDEATRNDVLVRMAELIPNGGYLVLGSSESIRGDATGLFEWVEGLPGVYRRK